MKFYVIGDADTVLGFSLADVDGKVVNTPEETSEALKNAFQNEDLGIIVITERVAQQIRHEVDQYIYKTTFPLIIEIPDREGPIQGRGSVRDMIRAAVGIQL
ncbi:V-type ATP synthase subunit F [bacterium]|nr:V-type ATP synthase subunit F [bacterium]